MSHTPYHTRKQKEYKIHNTAIEKKSFEKFPITYHEDPKIDAIKNTAAMFKRSNFENKNKKNTNNLKDGILSFGSGILEKVKNIF